MPLFRRAVHALLVVAALAGALAAPAGGQERVVVADVGPGVTGRLLQQVLARPHRLYPPAPDTLLLADSTPARLPVVVLDRTTIVEGVVRGDVIVVGGDLHVHPGARIEGRAIAIGGGVYPSTLAIVTQGSTSHRDHTFRVTRTDGGWSLAYQPLEWSPKPFSLPGLYGLRIPSYDRTNGLSLPVAPVFVLDSGRIELEPGVTWRTNLGKIDPSLAVRVQAGRRTRFDVSAARGTWSNERWIHSDLINSLQAIGLGTDSRNWFRADRAEGRAYRLLEWTSTRMEPFVGARLERGWSVGPFTPPEHTPWSLFGRDDEDGMVRPNPPIDPGSIASALLGTDLQWAAGPVTISGEALVESGRLAAGDRRFTQGTVNGKLAFLAFRNHRFELETHLVLTAGDTAPRQRFAWIGGSGTVPTLDLLEQGGDQLVFVESRYSIPIDRFQLPLVGPPTVTLRHILGGAAVHRFPTLTQNLGLRLGVGFIRGDVMFDPVSGEVKGGVGLSFAR
ncbi:MAG TPA: hypothetical protein VGD77_00360 [Gemmatimonadaceae bacterium]